MPVRIYDISKKLGLENKEVLAKAKELGQVIVDNTPTSADQTAAIRLLREAVMTANASIALDGKL